MKRRVSPLVVLLLLPAVVLLLPGCFGGEAQLQEPTAYIDPAVLDALQEQPEVRVLISLKGPDIPLAEQTTEVMRQHTAQVQARVLSVLTDADFTLIHQFEIAAALSGLITESGVEKLAGHADVAAVGMVGNGGYGFSQPFSFSNGH